MKSTLAKPESATRKGKPVSVFIPIKDCEELLERGEEADDLAWFTNSLMRFVSCASTARTAAAK